MASAERAGGGVCSSRCSTFVGKKIGKGKGTRLRSKMRAYPPYSEKKRVSYFLKERDDIQFLIQVWKTLQDHAATGSGTCMYVGNHHYPTRWGWASRAINWVRVRVPLAIYHLLFFAPSDSGGLVSCRGPGTEVSVWAFGVWSVVWAPKERNAKALGNGNGHSERGA